MYQISLQSGPKVSLPAFVNMFWDHFSVATFLQVSGTTLTSAASKRKFFSPFATVKLIHSLSPLQNVDLDKHISPRRSESNSPPFSVK